MTNRIKVRTEDESQRIFVLGLRQRMLLTFQKQNWWGKIFLCRFKEKGKLLFHSSMHMRMNMHSHIQTQMCLYTANTEHTSVFFSLWYLYLYFLVLLCMC